MFAAPSVRQRAHVLVAALIVSAGGCSNAPTTHPSCTNQTFGDPSKPIELVVGQGKYVFSSDSNPELPSVESSSFQTLVDGDKVDLRFPPQGGEVAWLGARVTNIQQSCGMALRASFFDLTTTNLVAYEQRSINLIPSSEMPGWAEPDVAHFDQLANVPMCPDYLGKDIVGNQYRLEIKVTDTNGREASTSITAEPVCADENSSLAANCQCQCMANYTTGKCKAPTL